MRQEEEEEEESPEGPRKEVAKVNGSECKQEANT